ncbi:MULTISPECIES: D-alanine--D-alanine ligase [unclassified Pseudoclavibacter]|uniref:D-alanine--D-alanine ligase family protein n=1 Tax=unclassified Pseudoclavibacter TaxID=2615177 RepID=UPI001301850D|nr:MULTISPECIES: D-alanine--D-alanine ligase [unclassified Pseudoclavibacter]KAB1657412.1 D-alanine--D-alanine ligase [Pseudoclavibacter sp. CFCC 11306]KAB1660715.1 D-alanine--D-alanine ligase [Pseudoclavibacter sp. CFCC 13796]
MTAENVSSENATASDVSESEADALNVLVLAGGISHEREVSVRGGNRVAEAIRRAGAQTRVLEPNARLLDEITAAAPDVIWSVLHGASGEDGALRDVLRLTGIPYVGSGPAAARLAWDKPTAKEIARRAGVQTPECAVFPRETFSELDAHSVLSAVADRFGYPLVLKPVKGGSAQGVSVVEHADELPRALVDAYSYSDGLLVERHVSGTEVAVSIIDTGDGPEALPIVEISPVKGRYTYEARYTAGDTDFYVPARLTEEVADRVAADAVAVHTALGLADFSRIDLIVDAAGTPWFIDANVTPGATETSLAPLAIRGAGRTEGEVYLDIARAAISRAHA